MTDYEANTSTEQYDLLGRLVNVKHPLVNNVDGTTSQHERTITYDLLENIRTVKDDNIKGHPYKTSYKI